MVKDKNLLHSFRMREFICGEDSDVNSFLCGKIECTKHIFKHDLEGKKIKKPKSTITLEAALELNDCHRGIHWDFSLWSEEDLGKLRAKAAKTKTLLNLFFAELELAFNKYEKEGK